ncbi:MAG: hypothetical protein JKY48_18535 [Flavobacteriales bacterium]|nr:hypothetical protein [Flavobacteriales bacterium]
MINYKNVEIASLIERFELKKLPKHEWTHEAHLVVAIWYCTKYEFYEALLLARDNISRHNESVGTENTDTGGYHETITKFWLIIANKFLIGRDHFSFESNCNALINSNFGVSSHPFDYYSPKLLFSVKARHNWINPDLKELKL